MKNLTIISDTELNLIVGGLSFFSLPVLSGDPPSERLTIVYNLPASIYSTITNNTGNTGQPGQAGFLGQLEAGTGLGIGDEVSIGAIVFGLVYSEKVTIILNTVGGKRK